MIGSPSRGNWIMLKMFMSGGSGSIMRILILTSTALRGFWRRLREHARRGDMWSDVNQPTLPHRYAQSQNGRSTVGARRDESRARAGGLAVGVVAAVPAAPRGGRRDPD